MCKYVCVCVYMYIALANISLFCIYMQHNFIDKTYVCIFLVQTHSYCLCVCVRYVSRYNIQHFNGLLVTVLVFVFLLSYVCIVCMHVCVHAYNFKRH